MAIATPSVIDDVPLGDSTDKLAIMSCNWENISADDLFVLIQTFLNENAPGRKCLQVAIHKSDYGEERIKREEEFGPEFEDMPSEDEENESLLTREEQRQLEERRAQSVRNYENQKKLYYFALADFDSINTACIIYDEMDGVAAGVCAELLDLRFVPEDTPDPSLKRAPISVCREIPEDYTPPQMDASNLTMQHSKIQCTWDEDTPERKMMLKKLSSSQIADLDLAAYLESASEDDDETVTDPADLRKALFGNNGEDPLSESDSEAFGDMEMKFSREVESVGKDVTKRLSSDGTLNKKSDMTLWEQYQVKRKEKGKAKKMARKDQIEQERQERIAQAKTVQKVAKKARLDEKKTKHAEHEGDGSLDIALDNRFAKLKKSEFAVDPTHPKFKK